MYYINHSLLLKKFSFVFILLVMVLSSCNDEQEFNVGGDFVESESKVIKVDSLSVTLSTVCLDSFPTSGNEVIWVGKYHDSIVGEIASSSVFEIGLPDIRSIEENDVYDSIALILTYNGNSIGDTTQLLSFSVHQVTNYIQLHDDGLLYNISPTDYDKSQLGAIEIMARPNSTEDNTIRIPLNDKVGIDFFNGLLRDKEYFSNYEQFTQYFNGVIINPTQDNNTIVGFKASYNDVIMRLYSHRTADKVESIINDFCLLEPKKQYNKISKVLLNNELQSISSQVEVINSSLTKNMSFLYGGAGLLTKVNFPTLEYLLFFNDDILLKAELIICPEYTHYDSKLLPDYLYLYETDKINRFGDVICDTYGYPISSILNIDDLYRENTFYSFDITKYINDELSDLYVDSQNGLLVTLPSNELCADFYNVLFSSKTSPPKLNLYFLTY